MLELYFFTLLKHVSVFLCQCFFLLFKSCQCVSSSVSCTCIPLHFRLYGKHEFHNDVFIYVVLTQLANWTSPFHFSAINFALRKRNHQLLWTCTNSSTTFNCWENPHKYQLAGLQRKQGYRRCFWSRVTDGLLGTAIHMQIHPQLPFHCNRSSSFVAMVGKKKKEARASWIVLWVASTKQISMTGCSPSNIMILKLTFFHFWTTFDS